MELGPEDCWYNILLCTPLIGWGPVICSSKSLHSAVQSVATKAYRGMNLTFIASRSSHQLKISLLKLTSISGLDFGTDQDLPAPACLGHLPQSLQALRLNHSFSIVNEAPPNLSRLRMLDLTGLRACESREESFLRLVNRNSTLGPPLMSLVDLRLGRPCFTESLNPDVTGNFLSRLHE